MAQAKTEHVSTIRKLTKDEPATKSVEVDEKHKIVQCRYTVKPNKDSDVRFEIRTGFDFNGVSDRELLELATKPVLVDMQRQWRGEKTDKFRFGTKYDGAIWKVREMLDETRQTADPEARAAGAVAKLTPEQKAALLEQLQAELQG